LKMSWNAGDPPWQDLLSEAGVKPISHSQRYAPGTFRHWPFSQRFTFSAHSSTSVEEVNYISIKFQVSWHIFFLAPKLNQFYQLDVVLTNMKQMNHIHLNKGKQSDSIARCLACTLTINHDMINADVSHFCLSFL
jgi:hypothetical protein